MTNNETNIMTNIMTNYNDVNVKYIVTLTNIGARIYDGFDEMQAFFIAEKSGFDCSLVMYNCGEIVAVDTYSPLNGWNSIT